MTDTLLEVDGSRHSGSGAIVRQAVAYAALTGRGIRMVNVRARRPQPGLRPQHVRAVEAIRDVTSGELDGVHLGARQFVFRPGAGSGASSFEWDIGSAGSATALALALLLVLPFRGMPTSARVRGGLFQDFAPSVFHLEHAVLPLLQRFGLRARVEMVRPGYVPRGEGILELEVEPVIGGLVPLRLERAGPVTRVWGIALSSHLTERRVSRRMADAARAVLASAGHAADIEEREDDTAVQAGAAVALFADRGPGTRLGADRSGRPRRSAENVGGRAARQLLSDLGTRATVDRFLADQLLPFAAVARGETRVRIPRTTPHVHTGAWLAELFLGCTVRVDGLLVTVEGRALPSPRP